MKKVEDKLRGKAFITLLLLIFTLFDLKAELHITSPELDVPQYSPIGIAYNNLLYYFSSESITVSSSIDAFDKVIIDDVIVAQNETSYWFSYKLDISQYCDGNLHKLQLKVPSYETCYFIAGDAPLDLFSEGIVYGIENETASVVGALFTIETAKISTTYKLKDKSYTVESISPNAFNGINNLTSAILPNSIKFIGKEAFNQCYNLSSIIIPESINVIEFGAFSDTALTTVEFNAINCFYDFDNYLTYIFPKSVSTLIIGEKVTRIPNYFLNGSHITSLTLPESVTLIGKYAFYNCSDLSLITLNEGLSEIGEAAFANCSGLTSINFPESLSTIGSQAFYGCSNLTQISIQKNVKSIGKEAFNNCDKLTSLEYNAIDCLPCGPYGFPSFPHTISDLKIGYDVNYIPENFLSGGNQIETLIIPSNVKGIRDNSFNNSSFLKILEFADSSEEIILGYNNTSSSGKGLFSDSPIEDLYLGRTYKIESSKSTSSFESNPSKYGYTPFPETISNVNFGDEMTYVPDYFLYNGSNIKQLRIPDHIKTIGKKAFYNNKIISLTIGTGITKIDDSFNSSIPKVFWFCDNPPSGQYSSNSSFLTNYVSNKEFGLSNQIVYPFLRSLFEVENIIYVPVSPFEGTCDIIDYNYQALNTQFTIDSLVNNKGVELKILDIANYSFFNNDRIESLILNNTGKIGEKSFANCDNLISADIKNGGNIGYFSFQNCKNLIEINIKNNGQIEEGAFSNCLSLISVYLDNKGDIGKKVFSNCESLSDIFIGSQINSIGKQAFENNISLKKITLPDNLIELGDSTFNGCVSLKNIEIGKGIKILPNSLFDGCSTLNNLNIPATVNTIKSGVFKNCTSLSNLKFEDTDLSDISSQHKFLNFPDWYITGHITQNYSKEYEFYVNQGDFLSFNYTINTPNDYIYTPRLIIKINDKPVVKANNIQYEDFSVEFEKNEKVKLQFLLESFTTSTPFTTECSIDGIKLTYKEPIDLMLIDTSGEPMFKDCPLQNIYIGRRIFYYPVADYGFSPFYKNTSLNLVEISNIRNNIFDYEFFGCSNLKSIKIGDSVKEIGDYAFSGCSSLESFSVGYKTEKIGEEAFKGCASLNNFYSYSSVPPKCGKLALDDINKWECILFVPYESSEKYKITDQWKDFFFINEMEAVAVTDILLNVEKMELQLGDSFQLNATLSPENASNQTLIWSSSNPAVATVSEYGLVTTLSLGETTITAICGDISASCHIVVNPILIESLILNIEETELNIGETVKLEATILPENTTDKTVIWQSSNNDVASVNESGFVTAISAGTATISATNGNISASCQITVLTPIIEVEQIVLNLESTELKVGETVQLEASVLPEDTTDKFLSWYSSDPYIATVSDNGLVTAVSAGTAIITVTCGEVSSTCEVTVTKQVIEPLQIVLNLESTKLKVGETVQLEATVLPENTTDHTIIWNSSNENVAVVSAAGLVTAITAGSAIITAACGEVSAECVISILGDAGVESLLANPESKISIYSTEGILIKKDCKVEDLKTLNKGIYIIISGKEHYKISI